VAAWIVPVGLLGLIALLALGGLLFLRTRPSSAAAERRDVIAYLTLRDGAVVTPPNARAEVYAPFDGIVSEVYASVGQRVKRGDALFEMRSPTNPTAKVDYEAARSAVRTAEQARDKDRGAYDAAVKSARETLEAARAAERKWRGTVHEAQAEPGVSEDGSGVTVTETTDAREQLSDAIAARQQAESALRDAEAQRAAALAPYEQRIQEAREELKRAEQDRKNGQVHAPLTGTLLSLEIRPGTTVGDENRSTDRERRRVGSIVDLEQIQVHVPLPAKGEQDGRPLSAVQPNAPVRLTFADASGVWFDGVVDRIVTSGEAAARSVNGKLFNDGGRVAIIRFTNRDGLVKPDSRLATAAIKLGEADNVVAVPRETVDQDRTGRPVVRVLRGGQWQPMVVETGLSDDRYTEIRSGLSAGETVQETPKLL